MRTVFWICFFALIYIYAGYPLFLMAYAVVRRKIYKKEDITPSVTLVIPAYNEEDIIEEKIKNSLSLDYPKDKLEIIIASDGSTDKTIEIAKRYADGLEIAASTDTKQGSPRNDSAVPSRNDGRANLILLDFVQRRGKPAVLNEALEKARGEIVVFSDASSIFDKDAVRKLVRNFADPEIGCVCGDYNFGYTHNSLRSRGEGLYVRYELFIKKKEAELGTLLGLHGAIYAIRKNLYPGLKPDMINDDYVISAKIVEAGYKSVYEEEAIAYEKTRVTVAGEFHRRMRIAAGNYQFIKELKGFLNPLKGIVFVEFVSHKILRTLTPFFMIGLFISSYFAQGLFYNNIFILQSIFYAMAFTGALFESIKVHIKLFYIPYYFCLSNMAIIMGFFKFITGRHSICWVRNKT